MLEMEWYFFHVWGITFQGLLQFLSEEFGRSDALFFALFAVYSGQLLRGVVVILGFFLRAHDQ